MANIAVELDLWTCPEKYRKRHSINNTAIALQCETVLNV